MPSRSLLRLVLAAILLVVAAWLAVTAYRALTSEAEPKVAFDPAEFIGSRPKLDAPYVATDYEVVDAMLAMAQVRPDDDVVDLGSGDGRILIAAARSHGARGLGVDIDPARIREAEANARAARVGDRVQFRREDLFATPLRDADVVTLYLTQDVNLRLRPRILSEMRPGARVVSHDFNMGDWRADQRQRIGDTNIYLWVVPARLGGTWTLTSGNNRATLELEQRYQELDGRVSTGDTSSRVEQGQVTGDLVRFIANVGEGRQVFEGRVEGNRIVPRQSGGRAWQAVRG